MTNPVSNLPSAQLPVPNEMIINPDGTATPLLHRFLTGLYLRTGGAAGASSSDTQAIAEAALTAATIAQGDAAVAQAAANAAAAAAGTAQNTANTASTEAGVALSSAQHALASQLSRSNNLDDVGSSSTARSNLSVAIVPAVFVYDGTITSSATRYWPVVTPLTIPANLFGTRIYAGTVGTADAVFTVSYIRSGTSHSIGTITVVNGGHTGTVLSVQTSVNVVAGDTLTVTAPSIADATLANLSITLAPTIT